MNSTNVKFAARSASCENPIFETCRAGFENRIFKGGAMKNNMHYSKQSTTDSTITLGDEI